MFKSGIKLTGKVNIKVINDDKTIDKEVNIENLVVTAGKNYVAKRIVDDLTDPMSHMAVGSSQTIQTLTDTALLQEVDRETFYSVTVTGQSIEYVATFAPGSVVRSLAEAGILNAASGGDLLCRTTFPPITQSTSQTIAISWVLSVG